MVRDVNFRIAWTCEMECLAESMSADPSEHPEELLKRLDVLRNNDSFCDVKIAVKIKQFKAHRAVLAASSPFFLTLLTSNMKESSEQLIKIELEEATESVMEDTLKYLYTGNVLVAEERAHNLIATANYLLLPSLKTIVANFLKETVTTNNCLFNYYFATKYECVELKEKCHEVIKSNFSVVMETEDFLSLDLKQVMEWVSSDDVIVNAEEDIFSGIVNWVSHKKSVREEYFPELLYQVRLSSVSHDFLLYTLVKEELITKDPTFCSNFVIRAMKSIVDSANGEVSQQPRKCQESHTDGIFICGEKKVLLYFPLENYWYVVADTLFEHVNPTLAWYKNKVYIFDSEVHKVGEAQVMECYEEFNNTWAAFQRATAPTRFSSYNILNGELYAIWYPSVYFCGKIQIYRYDSENKNWDKMEPSPFEATGGGPCIVNYGEFLYIISGCGTTTTSRYDSRENNWKELAAVNEGRWNAFGTAMNGKIYIAGGWKSTGNHYKELSSCEVYDPATNEWQLMPSLKVPRRDASMVCFQEQLYVLGRTSKTRRALTVEVFDPEKNEWTEISQMPVKSFESQEEMKKEKRFKACVARLCKKVIGKLKLLPTK